MRTRAAIWTGTGTSIPPSYAPTSTLLARQRGLPVDDAQRREGLGRSRGGLTTKIHTICDGNGRNLASHLTPGQDADTRELVRLLGAVAVRRPAGTGRPRSRLSFLCGDKGYSSAANRRTLRRRNIPHAIPERDDQKANRARKGRRGGRPPTFDTDRYRDRNLVERLMNRRKQFRAVATRYDKLGDRYRATVQIADIFIWLRAKPNAINLVEAVGIMAARGEG
jgi:transposase